VGPPWRTTQGEARERERTIDAAAVSRHITDTFDGSVAADEWGDTFFYDNPEGRLPTPPRGQRNDSRDRGAVPLPPLGAEVASAESRRWGPPAHGGAAKNVTRPAPVLVVPCCAAVTSAV